MNDKPDVIIERCGSVAMFTPMTAAANEWVDENVQVESWQRMGPSIACEPRCLESLVEGMKEAGLTIGD